MKQILQNLSDGTTELAELPCPQIRSGHLLIRTHNSLISLGTERMLVEFGRAGLIEKARQQPDKVRMVIDKIKTDGLMPTIDSVRSKLDKPLPMGYCNVGEVIAVGSGVTGFAVGDRVASNGHHAEIVCVPKNLCAKVAENVSDEAAAFTVVSSIALQGIRLAKPTLGEAFVVTGLGLIGLLAVQILRSHGCRVLGIDLDADKCALARRFGAETVNLASGQDLITAAQDFSRGRGVDGVLITAATKSNEPVHQAAQISRKRGRIVLVGVTGLTLSRADFYEKELSFQVSCSYGPGRYDPLYEEKGQDYPFGLVRWTEQRNFEAVLDMLADGRLDVSALITHRFPFLQAEDAYRMIGGSEPSLGIILDYDSDGGTERLDKLRSTTVTLTAGPVAPAPSPAVLGFIGSGNYATQVLIPAFRKTTATLKSVASSTGVSGVHAGRKFGFLQTTTDTDALIADPDITGVVITTRHDSHVRITCQALMAGKHVFVEKPLALTRSELDEVEDTYRAVCAKGAAPLLMVGFNRRFSPQVSKIKTLLAGVSEPKSFIMTVNAGAIPPDHWTQDPVKGGGRIIGEACHFVDLLRFLAGSQITSAKAVRMGISPGVTVLDDKSSLTLTFADGSFGTIHYLANGHKSFPKERLEIFSTGRIIQLDNFRGLRGFGWPGFKKMNLWNQDKGQNDCAKAFVDAIMQGSPSPIAFDELIEVARVTIELAEDLRA